jgi:hypothetical protein
VRVPLRVRNNIVVWCAFGTHCREVERSCSPNVDPRKNRGTRHATVCGFDEIILPKAACNLEMFTIKNRSGRKIVSRSDQDRSVGGASLEFVRWMHGHVPRGQLNPDQIALVEWFDKYRQSEGP